ncbi:PilW family protein [Desulfobulbus elongatus]|uniref:PilW family protein n=1 Tax=Desulfobulbus elongatus TaxID=53332 RepID=UPI00146FAFAC|nr:type II secretion system protein [Desulfobulbus elongatus]
MRTKLTCKASFAMMNRTDMDRLRQQKGFTLVELMIAMLVGGVVMAAVMTSFLSQHETYLAQDEVVEMQQNARVAMDMLTRDIRTIGYDPGGDLGAELTTLGIQGDGTASILTFTRDDGTGVLETIEYSLFDAYVTTGRNDGKVDDLAREEDGGGRQVVAENISQLEFRYLDEDGDPTNTLSGVRAIQVSMMVQATNPATKSPPPPRTYTTPSGATWTSDNGYRSLFLTSTVHCRNLGL